MFHLPFEIVSGPKGTDTQSINVLDSLIKFRGRFSIRLTSASDVLTYREINTTLWNE